MKQRKVPVGGQQITVRFVKDNHKVFGGDACYGITLKDLNLIYFAKGVAQSLFEDVYTHELLGHAAFAVAGVDVMLRDNLKAGVDPHQFEEEMVRKLTLAWHPFLNHHKFQFPKIEE